MKKNKPNFFAIREDDSEKVKELKKDWKKFFVSFLIIFLLLWLSRIFFDSSDLFVIVYLISIVAMALLLAIFAYRFSRKGLYVATGLLVFLVLVRIPLAGFVGILLGFVVIEKLAKKAINDCCKLKGKEREN